MLEPLLDGPSVFLPIYVSALSAPIQTPGFGRITHDAPGSFSNIFTDGFLFSCQMLEGQRRR